LGDESDVTVAFLFNDDGTVSIDGDDSVGCTADGASVTCDATLENPGQEGYDYTIVQEVAVDLVWDSSSAFSGTQSAEMDCVGADCAALLDASDLTLPCIQEYDIVGTLAEDAAGDE
jgi:hypothetical protein